MSTWEKSEMYYPNAAIRIGKGGFELCVYYNKANSKVTGHGKSYWTVNVCGVSYEDTFSSEDDAKDFAIKKARELLEDGLDSLSQV